MTGTLEWQHFLSLLGFPQNGNSTKSHVWIKCIPWAQKHMFRHQNDHPKHNLMEAIAETLKWQPSWMPS